MAFKHLNDFMASEGVDLRPLEKAYNCSLKILNLPVQVGALEVHFGAGIVAVSTAYTKLSKVRCPCSVAILIHLQRTLGGSVGYTVYRLTVGREFQIR